MKANLSALGAGLLFGAGLAISGMTQPSTVIAFLDVTGQWDPSLGFVMIGALIVHSILYRVIRGRASPLFNADFHVPTRRDIDAQLIAGAAIFGAGWGLSGLCPGPALVGLGGGSLAAMVFVVAMTLGILAARAFQSAPSAQRSPAPPA